MGLLAQPHGWALFTGLALQLVAGAAVTIRLNLYVLDNVSRARLTQFEPMRMFLVGIGWITGPLAGAYLSTRLASWAPFLLSTGFCLRWTSTSACRVRAATRRRLDHRPIRRISCDGFFNSRAWHCLDFVRRPLHLVERILYLYADLRRREWPRRGSGRVVFLVRLTLGLFTVTIWGWVGRRKVFAGCSYSATRSPD